MIKLFLLNDKYALINDKIVVIIQLDITEKIIFINI